MSKDSNLTLPDWDNKGIEGRIALVEGLYESLKTQMEGTSFERSSMKELMEAMRVRILELEALKEKHEGMVATLRSDNDENKVKVTQLQFENDQMRRNHETELDDLKRKYRYELDDLRDQHRHEIDRLHRAASDNEERAKKEAKDEIKALRERHELHIADLEKRQQSELDEEKYHREREVAELTKQRDAQIETIATTIGRKEREADAVRDDLNQKIAEVEREKTTRASLEARLEQKGLECLDLESSNKAMKAKINFLESDNQQQSQQFVNLHQKTQEAVAARDEALEKLRKEETLRRKLHNEIQELKGNIRVFCRVRPVLRHEEEEPAKIDFPDEQLDCREVVVMGQEQKSSLGTVTTAKHAFAFDRVFGPSSDNGQIFDEVSQLIQSALDGYNCCIFSYGQTGTGKSYLMSSADGMIPRAVAQIYEQARALEERGWRYRMEGSFVEVYNENLNDLLGTAEDLDKKKLEIRHDTATLKTAITGVTVVALDGPEAVEDVLRRADRNRSVAATKANQRSSRSHSVFILSLAGENEITGEKSEGTLNLVDLAGSERLAHSQAEGARLKETQNINKSLSCLGDVIGALGRGDAGHVPYRNSKLTYLLQYSLGGNSKTLMFVMISPLQAHLGETLTSLKFATKVCFERH
jgi:kinesin family protein C1